MIEAGTAFLLLALVVSASFAVGPDGARRCALVLALNWAMCSSFVAISGNYTPWAWFWVMDLLAAAAITFPPVSRWQSFIAITYMFQFGFHAGFGIRGGATALYLGGLDGLFLIQLLTVSIWTLGHGLYRFRRDHHCRASMLDKVLTWTAR